MKFKIDENLPVDVAEVLLANEHEADTIDAIVATGLSQPDIEAMLYGNAVRLFDLMPRR